MALILHPELEETIGDSVKEYTKENIKSLHEIRPGARRFLENEPGAKSVNVIALDQTASVVLYEISLDETKALTVLGDYDDLPD